MYRASGLLNGAVEQRNVTVSKVFPTGKFYKFFLLVSSLDCSVQLLSTVALKKSSIFKQQVYKNIAKFWCKGH